MAADPAPSTPAPRPASAPAGALAVGAHLGASVWWCEELFGLTGGWVPDTEEAPARIHLAELSRVMGETAVALAAHLPRPAPVDPRAWVAPPSPSAPEVVRTLDAGATLERLAGVHRILVPRLLVAWSSRLRVPGGGRALDRTLRHARSDLRDLGDDGEALVQAHVAVVEDGPRRAAAHTGAVEAVLVAAGGLTPDPPGEWPV